MSGGAVVVAGGGAQGLALAAGLTRAGHEVILFETEARRERIAPFLSGGPITVLERSEVAAVSPAMVTCDPFEAFAAADVLLVMVPPRERRAFGELLLPLVEPRHVLVVASGGLDALLFAHWLLARGRWIDGLATFAATDLEPYTCHRRGPDAVSVHGRTAPLGVGVFPASRTPGALQVLEPLLGPLNAYPHAAAAGLCDAVALLRLGTLVFNAARVERGAEAFLLYEDGFTPGVAAVLEALDAERRAVAAALGYAAPRLEEVLTAAGLGPRGDLWTTVHASRVLSRVQAPRALDGRWLSDGLAAVRAWVALGEHLDVPVPGLAAAARLASALLGSDEAGGESPLEALGVERMDRDALLRYLQAGETGQ